MCVCVYVRACVRACVYIPPIFFLLSGCLHTHGNFVSGVNTSDSVCAM